MKEKQNQYFHWSPCSKTQKILIIIGTLMIIAGYVVVFWDDICFWIEDIRAWFEKKIHRKPKPEDYDADFTQKEEG